LVKKSGYTLFVGIDDYDSPVNNAAFDYDPEKQPLDITVIEIFFGTSLFSTLKAACGDDIIGCVSKYFVMGVLPTFRQGITPLFVNTTISRWWIFHGVCGLNGYQVRKLVSTFLNCPDPSPSLDNVCRTLKEYYNGYYFAEDSDLEEHLYNLHHVNHHLFRYEAGGRVHVPEQAKSVHSECVLQLIPDTGNFSMEDIIELLANGYIKSKVWGIFGSTELEELGEDKATTLSFLMYSGVLTRDVDFEIFRIPNKMMKIMVCGFPFRSVDF
jgi:Predicted AAA-ATPase